LMYEYSLFFQKFFRQYLFDKIISYDLS